MAKKKRQGDRTHTTGTSPPTAQEKVVSVFLIPEFDCNPPEYVINFENKSTAGFHPRYFWPSGNIEPTDASPEAATMRECAEETGIVITDLNRNDLIGKLQVTNREGGGIAYIYIYTKRIPSDTRTRPGDEQIEVLRIGAEDIEKLVAGDFIGIDHATAWKLYKQIQARRSRQRLKK